VTTAGSDFDTAVEVYTGSALSALTRVACDDDGVSGGVLRTGISLDT
jgi:hypothetical protein